jgi:hypothetical protein
MPRGQLTQPLDKGSFCANRQRDCRLPDVYTAVNAAAARAALDQFAEAFRLASKKDWDALKRVVLSLYARGLTTGEISAHFEQIRPEGGLHIQVSFPATDSPPPGPRHDNATGDRRPVPPS